MAANAKTAELSREGSANAIDLLAGRLDGEFDLSKRRRAEYSSDASNYRVVPEAVIFPASDSDVVTVVEAARETGTPITARGGGTSVAGNAIGTGWVLDFSRHMNRIIEVDVESKTARVQPGVVMGELQKSVRHEGLRFGPDPSTQARCTIGGMIGNNACGSRGLRWGRTADSVHSLRLVDGTGRVSEVATGFGGYPALDEFVRANLALLRVELGRFTRQISGYSLEHLLPENRFDLAKALVGTEGTCGIVLESTVQLVDIPAATVLTVLGYPDTPTAADDVSALLPLRPLTMETMDSYLLRAVRQQGGAVPDLPAGDAWLFVETTGATVGEAMARANEVVEAAAAQDSRIVPDGPEARALWRIREDGVGLAGRTPEGEPAWAGWEDAAVPPDSLGRYLRDFEALKAEHGLVGPSFGHAGEGCVHTRLDLPLHDGPNRFKRFLEDAADLVATYGGSLSGEHGDGRARGELLTRMYSPDAISAFAQFKSIFDPEGVLNPGIVVDPLPVDADLRVAMARPVAAKGFALVHDRGDFTRAVHRCVGVGKCRADNSAAGGFMCPSYLATRDEKDSTRGRARVLQEMANGSLVADGWSAPEVAESLDLCLSCKACGSDCPAGVDMATYKSEMLYRRFKGRIRPISHYSFGWLPRWLRLAALAPWAVNALARIRPLVKVALWFAGADTRREIPVFPKSTFRARFRRRGVGSSRAGRPQVVLWMDSFTNGISPEIGEAAVQVLESAGYEVKLTQRQECCGLTWITTGQLDGARRLLSSALDALEPYLDANVPIVGLEPSCTAVLRSDVVELLPHDPRSNRVAKSIFTLAEFLTAPRAPHAAEWVPPRLDDVEIVAQPHCHQHAVMGWDIDRAFLESAGASVSAIAGCCGLAGNFGMERGHYDVSVAVAENGLLPALRGAPENAYFLADGFSCRTQAEQLARRDGKHLAQLLAERLGDPSDVDAPAPSHGV